MADRRRRPTPMFSRYWLRGRRRGGRRDGERERIYVDVYTKQEIALVFGLVALSAVDLTLTLVHVSDGGREANPIMAWVLEGAGSFWFATAKLVLTISAALIFLLHVRFRLGRSALLVVVAAYVLLMVWHGFVAADRGLA